MKKILIVLLASLIGMVLCSGVATAQPGNCCYCSVPCTPGELCECFDMSPEECIASGGIVMVCPQVYEPCGPEFYCDESCKCVPEITTIALLATGLICMAGYFRLRRKEK